MKKAFRVTVMRSDGEKFLHFFRKGGNASCTVFLTRLQDVYKRQVDELTWQGTRDDYAEKAKTVGVLREQNEDLRSLKEFCFCIK